MATVIQSPEFDKHLNNLANRQIVEKLGEVIILMKKDTIRGDHISKKLFPKEYVSKYRINNLWRYPINSHRLLYTIITEHHQKKYGLISILTHNEYNKLFHYKSH